MHRIRHGQIILNELCADLWDEGEEGIIQTYALGAKYIQMSATSGTDYVSAQAEPIDPRSAEGPGEAMRYACMIKVSIDTIIGMNMARWAGFIDILHRQPLAFEDGGRTLSATWHWRGRKHFNKLCTAECEGFAWFVVHLLACRPRLRNMLEGFADIDLVALLYRCRPHANGQYSTNATSHCYVNAIFSRAFGELAPKVLQTWSVPTCIVSTIYGYSADVEPTTARGTGTGTSAVLEEGPTEPDVSHPAGPTRPPLPLSFAPTPVQRVAHVATQTGKSPQRDYGSVKVLQRPN